MVRHEPASASMVCVVENIFQDGEWSILEWQDPVGFRGCGFFHVVGGQIVFQRGYWDKLCAHTDYLCQTRGAGRRNGHEEERGAEEQVSFSAD